MNAKKLCELYESRSEKTYRSRLAKSKRLMRRRDIFRIVIALLNFTTIIIVILPFLDLQIMKQAQEPGVIAIFIVFLTSLTIVLGQYVVAEDYDRRIAVMEYTYREIQIISQDFEALKDKPHLQMDEVRELIRRYQGVILRSENHDERDYREAFGKFSRWRRLERRIRG